MESNKKEALPIVLIIASLNCKGRMQSKEEKQEFTAESFPILLYPMHPVSDNALIDIKSPSSSFRIFPILKSLISIIFVLFPRIYKYRISSNHTRRIKHSQNY